MHPSRKVAILSVKEKRDNQEQPFLPGKKAKFPNKEEMPPEDLKKSLTPEVVNDSPVIHRQRVQFLHVIRDKLAENGYKNANTRAIAIEKDVAQRCTQFTYPMGIRTAVRGIITHQLDNEEELIEQTESNQKQILCRELTNLLVPLRELEKRRYVITKPEASSLESTQIVNCARCFSKFPAYNPSASTTSCRFHLLKRPYDPNIKKLSPLFPCCGEALDEGSGCETRDFHVYKLDTASEMEGAVPFINTPEPKDETCVGEFAVGLDCEMAWTSKGFELIRITVVSYIERKTILDRLVWPKGKILDLNTRFSGVSSMDRGVEFEGRTFPPLALEELYTELFKLISSKTIIIGHGLENDLNALRLIHHRVVDTAILFPRSKTRTHSLKELTWDFLSRSIQIGEHDSMEDSLAAIDIVRKDIENRCFRKLVKSFK